MTGTSEIPSFSAAFKRDHLAIATGQDWNLEAELLDGSRRPINRVIVLSWVARVRDEVDRTPGFDVEEC
jgi:hypothetical protein